MVVEILIPQGQRIHALAQKAQLSVGDEVGVTGIGDDPIDGLHQPGQSIGLAQQHHPAIGGDLTAAELRLHPAAFDGWKIESRLGTV